MLIWVGCIRLKLTFWHRKLNVNFEWLWSLEVYRLTKFLTPIQTEFFQYPSSSCTYHWGIRSLKNNSTVSRSSYLYIMNQTIFPGKCFFIQKINKNFMLNTTMENKIKRFASISTAFPIPFIMKLIAQIKILFSLNWGYFS